MNAIKALFEENFPAAFATACLTAYFFGMAIVFIIKPLKNAESFSIKPVDNAGKTEIRVYYGGMFFATTVFVTRTIFLFVDKGWKCPYTKLAIPAEGAFVIALWTCFFLAK